MAQFYDVDRQSLEMLAKLLVDFTEWPPNFLWKFYRAPLCGPFGSCARDIMDLLLSSEGSIMKFIIFLFLPAFAFAVPKFSADVPVAVKDQMIKDLELTQKIEGGKTSKLYLDIFQSATLSGPGLNSFFDQRILNVDLGDCGVSAAVACVKPYLSNDTMFLTPIFVKTDIPQILRVSILFHESRHTERSHGGWGHAICPTPFLDSQGRDIISSVSGVKLQGLPGCDNVALGAYGMEAVFLKNIGNVCTNCSEKVQMDAELFGDDILLRISDANVQKLMRDDLQKK